MKRSTLNAYLFLLLISACSTVAVVRLSQLRTAQAPSSGKTNLLHAAVTNHGTALAHAIDAARIYMLGGYLPTWKAGIKPTKSERKEQKRLFRYDLKIEHIIDTDPTIIANHARPTLFLHGWGDMKNCAHFLKAFADVLPGDVITFNFHDRGIAIPKIHHSNLGQLPDVLTAIYTLAWAHDHLQLDQIDLFGYSRGGATVINMLAVLNNKTGAYDNELARISITPGKRQQLLAMIQRGCITLDCPLSNANVSAGRRFKKIAPHLLNLFEKIGPYHIDGIQALESATQLEGMNLNLLLHFQHNDTIVFNDNEAELYKRLAQHNPNTTYIVLGNNGGHIHTHASLAHAIHTFKKQCGSSYDPTYDAHYENTRSQFHDAHVLLQPGDLADEVIKNYYQQCSLTYAA